jgi:pilus assembly protein CpaE
MRALVVSPSPQDAVAVALQKLLQPASGWQDLALASFANATAVCAQAAPELVFVLVSSEPERGRELIQRLRASHAGHLLAVGHANDAKLILRTMQVGADLFLDEDDLEAELQAGLARLRFKQEGGSPAGRLVAVLSASGGCGGSTLAVNLAAALARDFQKCCLIDLNPGRGDQAALLDLKPQYTLADVCVNEARLDQAMFDKLLTRHSCGIALLASPSRVSDAKAVTASGVGRALSLARKAFPQVVVDLEDYFHDEQVVVLHEASGVLLVCRLDFTSLRHARRALDYLGKIGVARQRVKVVINGRGQPNELPVDDAEDALGEKLTHFVPYDARGINAANNTGIPSVLRDPTAKVSQAVVALAKTDFEKPSVAPGFLRVTAR